MYRHFSFDLGYTHDVPRAAAPRQPIETAAPLREASDLSARLRYLKTLIDAERDAHLGPCLRMAQRANRARVRANPGRRGVH